ncbi:LPS assembly lipoprotein LptE [Alteromonadaceae bacterium BrNp21-10]|nr:LPS assembly lipoprotein LptE [Alteromonadaceae bacterium BrNp21-10]
MTQSKVVCLLLTVALSISLSACGFKLRGDFTLPDNLQKIELLGVSNNDPLFREVKSRLQHYKISVTDKNPLNGRDEISLPRLTLLQDNLERRLLSLFATGQVAEYELIYTVSYTLLMPGENDTRHISFDIVREHQDDPDAVLAKSRELNLILKEMRRQAADKIMRQLTNLNQLN